jgi:hypothetical protein
VSAPKFICKADLELALDEGLTRPEMVKRFGVCLRIVGTMLKQYGLKEANARLLKARQNRVIEEWVSHGDKYTTLDSAYRSIAGWTGLSMMFVERTILEYKRSQGFIPRQKRIAVPVKPQAGNTVYRNTPVKVLKHWDGTTQIILHGSPTWVPSCEVRKL